MKRTQIQLDEKTYELLRRRAFEEGRSISAIARRILGEALGASARVEPRTVGDFAFIGAGRSDPDSTAHPISERHDEALAEDFRK